MNIYYKDKVEEYNNEDCFLLYFPKGGMFINTPKETIKIFENNFYDNSINKIEIDTYARTREFKTVVKFRRPKHLFNDRIIEWFNDFDKNEKMINKLKNRLNNAALSIYKAGVLHIPQDIASRSIVQEIFGFISKINRE